MRKWFSGPERKQTVGEEVANSISHGVALAAAIAAVPLLIVSAVDRGSAASVVGAAIFASTLVLLYLASTLYHALPGERTKRFLKILDHSAIYLLIAGSYTPFTLGVLRGAWGWTFFGLVWGLASVGVLLKAFGRMEHPVLSTCLYVAMGWLVVMAVEVVWREMPRAGVYWLLAGGIAYTAGVLFFAAHRLKYSHLAWHLFVMAGSACHVVAVLRYAG